MVVISPFISMPVSAVQPRNALFPIVVTLSGIIIYFKALHPWNALALITVMLSGITKVSRDSQP